MTPREFFPKMPDEVFDMWIGKIIEGYGWPFKKPSDSAKGTKWHFVLGRISLEEWTECEWRLEQINIASEPIHPLSIKAAGDIIINAVKDRKTPVASVVGSKERFWTLARFIEKNRKLPVPIVVIRRDGYIEIVDGSHRIAALIHLKTAAGIIVQAWVPDFS